MTMWIDKMKEGAKSIASLLSGIIVAVLALGVDQPLAKYLGIAAAIIGAILVWSTPNALTPAQRRIKEAGEQALMNEHASYSDLGGVEYPDDPTDADSGTPENTRLYESGEAPAFDVTADHTLDEPEVSGNLAQPKGVGSDAANKEPYVGGDHTDNYRKPESPA